MSKIMSSKEAADAQDRNKDIQSRKEGGQHWLSFAVLQLVLPERLAVSCSLALCMCLFWLENTVLCVRCSTISPVCGSLIADPLQGHSASLLNKMLHFALIENLPRPDPAMRDDILSYISCIFSYIPYKRMVHLSKSSKNTDQSVTN